MKKEEKIEAIKLRKEGNSIKAIARKINVAVASVSVWVRDVQISNLAKNKINKNRSSFEVIERRRATRLKNEAVKRNAVIDAARKRIGNLNKNELFLIGTALYWAEGGKTKSMARFSNSDPKLIKIMMLFFRKICNVPESKFRFHIHTHSHINKIKCENYWSDIVSLPKSQFYKTYCKPSISSKGKADRLPYGTCDIYVCDTKLFLTIKGWCEGINDSMQKYES